MSPDSATKFLKALGIQNAHYDPTSNWVSSSCPLAPWTHKGGADNRPSFGVRVNEMRPYYHCFTCRAGDLTTLIQEIEMFVGKNPGQHHGFDIKAARAILENEGFEIEPLPEFSEFTLKAHEFQEWPTYFIDSFYPCDLHHRPAKYLKSRNVPAEVANAHGLKYDSKRDMIVFPYHNLYGKLAGARGRAIELPGEPPTKYRHHDYTWNHVNNAALVWYNEEALTHDKPVVVVEGQFDQMRVSEVYPYAIANMTAKPSAQKLKKLEYAPAIVLMMDNDEAADAAIKKYVHYLDAINKPVAVVQPPKEYTPSGKLIKHDPDSMGVEWVREQLKSLDLI